MAVRAEDPSGGLKFSGQTDPADHLVGQHPTSGRREGLRMWWAEASGAVADLGVLVPIAVALIVMNGLSVTAVLLPAGLLYLLVAVVFRVPVAVQPLKAFGALAIAMGAGSDLIAAGALLMGVIFVVLGTSGLIDRVAHWFPLSVVRGVQLAVALAFAKIAWGLLVAPAASFVSQLPAGGWAIAGAVVIAAVLLRWPVTVLPVVVFALVWAGVVSTSVAAPSWGPTPLVVPELSWSTLGVAMVVLVIPQLPLTFANSCVAPADAARSYFADHSTRVTPGRLALTLGGANIAIAAVSGMPLCHGAGGMSAHYAFGARSWRAPVIIGTSLVAVALLVAADVARVVTSFPLVVLAALLVVAGLAHVRLMRDLDGWRQWTVALAIGLAGAFGYLLVAVVVGIVAETVWLLVSRRRAAEA